MRPQTSPRRLKTAPRRSQDAPRLPRRPQDGPKTRPRRPQDAPQDAPRRPPGAENFGMKNGFLADPLHRRSQDAPRLPRRPQDGPKMRPIRPQDAHRTPPGRPRDAPGRPKTPIRRQARWRERGFAALKITVQQAILIVYSTFSPFWLVLTCQLGAMFEFLLPTGRRHQAVRLFQSIFRKF